VATFGPQQNLAGRKVGSRVVLENPERLPVAGKLVWHWPCRCERCGVVRLVLSQSLIKGHSCPCDLHKAATPTEVDEMARRYVAGEHCGQIGESLGYSTQTVWKCLKRRGVQTRTPGESHRRYTINHAVFDSDGREVRYWLGFALADCNVASDGDCFSCNLKRDDRGHLEKLRDFLGSNAPIEDFTNTGFGAGKPASRLVIWSKQLCESLSRRGIYPQKSHVAVVPPELAADADFFRGLVDGDGWICWGEMGLTGTKEVCESFLAYVRSFTATRVNVTRNHGQFKVSIRSRSAVRGIYTALYGDCPVVLERKRAAAHEWLAAQVARSC
jgi:hypothetical protein